MCEKENLIQAVNIVGRLATARSTLPILQNIYLELTDTGLVLRSTDLEQTLEAKIDAEVKEKGRVTVPARLVTEYLQNNTDHSLTLFTDDLTLHIHSTNHQASFKGLAAEEYPSLPQAKVGQKVELQSEELVAAINRTIFAAALDDTRPVLGGLLWRFGGDSLELVGTDGYRLAYTKAKIATKLTGDYIIPRRSLQELVRILGPDKVEVSFAGTQVKFRQGEVELTSRILEGKFPDYAAILPKKSELKVTVASSALAQSLKLASLFSRDSAYSTKLTLEGDKLRLHASSVSLGDNVNEVTLNTPVDKPFAISLNAQYLIEALSHISGEVSLEFVDSKSPIVLRPSAGADYLYLVMPLRLE
ncbi:MAG: DNA polymerase III subunit beta [Candidatus Berkelbacteria bacterium]|nr:MAG: DNA polymerase III subunit beta [Candidatus Berkelbacteria bacterium]QQG51720.1 MAG: DNA polymerase III subunit beta [Candidatus Berkelbacteria bacterium]